MIGHGPQYVNVKRIILIIDYLPSIRREKEDSYSKNIGISMKGIP